MQLDVVAAYANPIRWKSRLAVHQAFEQHMLSSSNVRLTTVECAYGERPFELQDHPSINRVRVRAYSLVWNKENLLNIGMRHLPTDSKYICTSDADIRYRKPGWAMETVHALQLHHVVQPWSHCYDLGPNDDHLEPVHHAFIKEWLGGNPMTQGIDAAKSPYRFGHCGFAWAWTRQAMEWLGGLLEVGALGAGDHHMALALIGKAYTSLPGYISKAYAQSVFNWQARATHHINGNLSFVPGTIEHSWHGKKENRKYVSRWDILKKHSFDPSTDVKYNLHGVLELAGNKPGLRQDIEKYFTQRNEDATTLDP